MMKNKKYVVVSKTNGMDYRSIAEIMTSEGEIMNHATARNIIIKGFEKVIKGIAEDYGIRYSREKINEIAKSPDFQDSIIEILKKEKIKR